MTVERRNDGGPIDFVVTNSSELSGIVNPKIGQFALATADGTLWYHTGSAWAATAGGTGGGGIAVDTGGNVS